MDLRQLRYFVSIVEEGSFSKAALSLRVAQPALSLHVRNMEAALGTELLLRTPQGIRATAAGRILFDNARSILAQFEATKREIVAESGEPSGEVRIGLPGTISQHLAVPLILKTRRLYPRVQLRVMEAMSGFILEWLRDERIDIALLYIPVDERGLKSYQVLEEELCLFGPAAGVDGVPMPASGDVVTPADLAGIPLILPSVGHGLRMLVDERFGRGGTSLETVIDVDSYASIKECVGHALAYSILPVTAVAAEVAAGQFRSWRIGSPPLSRAVHLAHAFERPVSRAGTVVEALCRETLTELVRSGAWQARLVLEPGPDGEGTGTP
ncbi:MAG: LysR substrate-binding domain-containing protein [Methylobacterium sp.]